MDRVTYLTELAKALSGLGDSDRHSALAYYGEYLAEAEAAGQTDASAALGSPLTLAAQIKAEIAMGDFDATIAASPTVAAAGGAIAGDADAATNAAAADDGAAAPTDETPATATPEAPADTGEAAPVGKPAWGAAAGTPPRGPIGPAAGVAAGAPTGAPYAPPQDAPAGAPYAPPQGAPVGAPYIPQGAQVGTPPPQDTPKKSGIGVIWTVVLAILAIPVGLPLAIAVVAVIFSVLVTLVALFFALAAVVVALLAAGILSWVVGIYLLFADFATGLFYLGAGFVTLGLCLLFGMAFWQLGKLCARGVARLFNAIRKRLARRERKSQ